MEKLEEGLIYQITTTNEGVMLGRYKGTDDKYYQFVGCFDLKAERACYVQSFYIGKDAVKEIRRPKKQEVDILINHEIENNIEP